MLSACRSAVSHAIQPRVHSRNGSMVPKPWDTAQPPVAPLPAAPSQAAPPCLPPSSPIVASAYLSIVLSSVVGSILYVISPGSNGLYTAKLALPATQAGAPIVLRHQMASVSGATTGTGAYTEQDLYLQHHHRVLVLMTVGNH